MTTSLEHFPASNKWEFDTEVTACFDDMLERSIPQYRVMRQLVFQLGCHFVHAGSRILDLGCSKGDALEPFVRRYGATCTYHGVEISPPMLEAAQQRFQAMTTSDLYGNGQYPHVQIEALDLRREYPGGSQSLTLAILTLMFIPMEYRQRVLENIYKHLEPGGCLLLVEKVLGANAWLDELMVEGYLTHKRERGYSEEAILRKRFALEGVLVPLTVEQNRTLLMHAGFIQVDCFWRWLNFAGWCAIK